MRGEKTKTKTRAKARHGKKKKNLSDHGYIQKQSR